MSEQGFYNPEKTRLDDKQVGEFYKVMVKSVVVVRARCSDELEKKQKKKHLVCETSKGKPDGKGFIDGKESIGTGVFVVKGGSILTCAHVVSGYDIVEVRTLDGEMFYKAKCVYKDEHTNLALLRVCDRQYDDRDVKLAGIDSVTVGMQVLCIKNSYELPFSLGVGHVAYKCDDVKKINLDVTASQLTRGCRLLLDLAYYTESDLVLSNCDPSLRLVEVRNVHVGVGGYGTPYFDASGCLIGIFLLSLGTVDFGIHVYHIKSFLKKALGKRKVAAGQKRRGKMLAAGKKWMGKMLAAGQKRRKMLKT